MDIVRFKSGLGNQMFQYAFMKALEKRDRMVFANLGYYRKKNTQLDFQLKDVFPQTCYREIDDEEFYNESMKWDTYKEKTDWLNDYYKNPSKRFFWVENENELGKYIGEVFETTNCAFVGYWQTYKYFNDIRNEICEDFTFKLQDPKLKELYHRILNGNNYISVHIRRGDYLNEKTREIYGNICTDRYYREAFGIIEIEVKNPIFVFVSDDISWVKMHYSFDNAIYVEPILFNTYCDWYDMCLMSVCSYNIIANSTFSWWGAWLNNRENHMVIAPSIWQNGRSYPDICPPEWIRI